jgi:hypothetical protein
MSAQPTVKNFHERLELYSSKNDAIEIFFGTYDDGTINVNNYRKSIHERFEIIKSYLDSRNENELLQGGLLKIFDILLKFDINSNVFDFLELIQTIYDVIKSNRAIDNLKDKDISIYFSIRKDNEEAKMDLTLLFPKKASKPWSETPGAESRSFFTNMNEKKIMVYNGIKFIPDQYARPRRGSDGEFYLEIYGEKFPCFSNIDISTNSIENPVIISIEPRRKIFHI